MIFFQLSFGAIFLKPHIAFSRYGNFIDDVITDQRKMFLKFGNQGKVLYDSNSKVHFTWKSCCFYFKYCKQFRESSSNLENKYWRLCEISKLTMGPYFEIFWLCTTITRNPSFFLVLLISAEVKPDSVHSLIKTWVF